MYTCTRISLSLKGLFYTQGFLFFYKNPSKWLIILIALYYTKVMTISKSYK